MIILDKIVKKYKNTIINDLSYTFKNAGIYAISGDSGSGKTTLLNIISGLDFNYFGEVKIDGINLRNLQSNERNKYRLENIGYLFQDFKLLNLLDVENNIIFNLDAISSLNKNTKNKLIANLLSKLNLKEKQKTIVNKLSGGEKQRVALARAIITSPKLLLCDEPTGNLDENSAEIIFNVLKEYSKNNLVIVVSHDLELIKKYADVILHFKDGTIVNEEIINNIKDSERININIPKKLIPKFSFSMLIKTGIGKFKEKKFRSAFSNIITSISLLALGIGIIISTSLRNEITSAFSSVVASNEIIVTRRNNSSTPYTSYISTEEEKVRKIRNEYSDYFYGDGVSYLNDFNTLFSSYDRVYIQFKSGKRIYLDTFSSKNFSNYVWREEKNVKKFYPSFERELDLGEVILGLTYQDMINLCISLQINRSYEDLGNYLSTQNVMIGMSVANYDWYYENDEYFHLVSVYQSLSSEVLHTNHYFNEFIFEGDMQLPSTRELEIDPSPPWTLKRVNTLHCIEAPTSFIEKINYQKEYDDLLFERKENVSFDTCIIDDTCPSNIVYVFTLDKNAIDISDIIYFKKAIGDIESYYFSSTLGYQMHESGMLEGFVDRIGFSFDEAKAIEVGDYFSKEIEGEIEEFEGVAIGSITKYNNKGVLFSSNLNELINGENPKDYSEIVVSTGLLKYLNIDVKDALYKELFYTSYNSTLDRVILNYFKIVGIKENENNYIYHNPLFSISFFRDKLGISSFNLLPTKLILNIDKNSNVENSINLLNASFKKYKFTSPLLEIGKTVDEVMNYVETIAITFALITFVVTIMLLALTFYLNILESQKEIKLLKHLGHNKTNIISYILSHSIVTAIISSIFAILELLLFQILLSTFLGNMFGNGMKFSFNIIPYLVVLLIGIFLPIFISFLVTYFCLNKVNKKK